MGGCWMIHGLQHVLQQPLALTKLSWPQKESRHSPGIYPNQKIGMNRFFVAANTSSTCCDGINQLYFCSCSCASSSSETARKSATCQDSQTPYKVIFVSVAQRAVKVAHFSSLNHALGVFEYCVTCATHLCRRRPRQEPSTGRRGSMQPPTYLQHTPQGVRVSVNFGSSARLAQMRMDYQLATQFDSTGAAASALHPPTNPYAATDGLGLPGVDTRPAATKTRGQAMLADPSLVRTDNPKTSRCRGRLETQQCAALVMETARVDDGSPG